MDHNTNPNDAPYYDEIRRYCIRLTKSEAEAEDIVQEVYVRYCKSGRDLQGDHLRNWLFRTARTRVIDKIRTKHPERIAPDLEGASSMDAPDARAINPETAAERQELIRLALSMLECCDDRTREMFRLRFYENNSYSEIGIKVGLPTSTVRNIILNKLQELLEAFQKMDVIG